MSNKTFQEQTTSLVEKAAGKLYEEYCKEVGGEAVNGDPLPSWYGLSTNPNKQKQYNAWLAVARLALAM